MKHKLEDKPRRISLYWGLNIFPSLLPAVGYSSGPRSSAISELFALSRPGAGPALKRDKFLSTLSRAPPGSWILLLGILFASLRILDMLGSPNSSSSKSSLYIYCWLSSGSLSSPPSPSSSYSPSVAVHSLLICFANRGYVDLGAGEDIAELDLVGGGERAFRAIILEEVGVGVREVDGVNALNGRQNWSNTSRRNTLTKNRISACLHESRKRRPQC